MKREEFDALTEKTVERTAKLLISKGAEYAGDGDRLANFKRNAEKNGQTVLECWQIYWGKHIDSINSYMLRVKDRAVQLALKGVVEEAMELDSRLPTVGARSISDLERIKAVTNPVTFRQQINNALPQAMREIEETLSEPIEGRFDDNINYSILCQAILKELRG